VRSTDSRRSGLGFFAAALLALSPLFTGCAGTESPSASDTSPTAVTPASPMGSTSPTTTAAPPTQTASPSTTLDVAGSLLVVRRQEASWTLVRLTPATGRSEVLGTLPFRPERALPSPDRSRVLYLGRGSRLAVVEASSGAVRTLSFEPYPISAIDGATWVSDREIVFGGGDSPYTPDGNRLYLADATTGAVSAFRGLAGGEPSYATDAGSLIYVTYRPLARAPYPYRQDSGPWVRETIWRLRSLDAKRPQRLTSHVQYIDAGRLYNQPLLSPDGRWVLSAQTGTDVSVTYSLLDVDLFGMALLECSGGSPKAAVWGGDQVAFQQSLLASPGGKLAVFVYDTATGSLAQYLCPGFTKLDWSANGDLVGDAWRRGGGQVFASAASDLGEWTDLGRGLVPVWIK